MLGAALCWVVSHPLLAQSAPNPAPVRVAGETPIVLDHVIGVINGDVLLESDVQEEMHFAALQPYSIPPGSNSRPLAAERLVNRTLILQQMNDPQQPQKVPLPTPAEVQQRIDELKKQIPACRRYHCETEKGWNQFLAANQFTEEQVEARWRERLQILKFTEVRFRSGIRIPHSEIETYYDQHLLPEFQKEKVTPPPLNAIEPRIEEILLQERVNVLMQDWLKNLREQGNVLILDPSYGLTHSPGQDPAGGMA